MTRIALACGLALASGIAALAYQIVWTQQATLWLGHEAAAVLAVVAAFFGGIAAGSLVFSSRIERAARPHRWYAACEVLIGAWSLALAFLLKPTSDVLLEWIGPQPSGMWHATVAFVGTFLVLLPATMAMGATLPAMERVLRGRGSSRTIGILYAFNTLGAVFGVLAAAFWLVPEYGLLQTAMLCAVLNVTCGAIALFIGSSNPEQAHLKLADRPARHALLSLLAATGLLGIGYEVLVVRALSQVTESTVYTFAILLAVYLIGTTIGAAMHARWLTERFGQAILGGYLLVLAGTCVTGLLALSQAQSTEAFMLGRLGTGVGAHLTSEALLATMAFLLPTILMGALFSHLATTARRAGVPFGLALGINTLGASLAPLLFSVLLLPVLGLKYVLLLVAVGYVALAFLFAPGVEVSGPPRPLRTPLRAMRWPVALVTLACLFWAPSLQIVTVPPDGRLVEHIEGATSTVSVVEDARGEATLHIDNHQQEGSSETWSSDARQGLLPMLLHPQPKRALFLGVGTGLTASSGTLDPGVRVDAVELVPEVIDAMAHFGVALPREVDSSRLNLIRSDARRFIRTTREHYDVIVADNFHPARSGSGSLYTVEHFELVKSRLAPEGLFCQWLPLHQLDLDALRSIVRSYLAVFPHGAAILATNSLETPTVGLVSRRHGERLDASLVRRRLAEWRTYPLDSVGVPDDLALLGSFIAGPRALAALSRSAPLNTDDHPVVAYRAPRLTYTLDSMPRDRLINLLRELASEESKATPGEILANAPDSQWLQRLDAYWSARNQFIEAGRNVVPSADVHAMLAQVRGPLLSVLHVSPDFRPAYDPLLNMAAALSQIDVGGALALLSDLEEAQPARPEARQMRHEVSQRCASRAPYPCTHGSL